MIKKIKRRALYKYICHGCGKKRNSLIYDRASGEMCRLCRNNEVPENQPSLFTIDPPDLKITELKPGKIIKFNKEENDIIKVEANKL